jgi:hypothetical protein
MKRNRPEKVSGLLMKYVPAARIAEQTVRRIAG